MLQTRLDPGVQMTSLGAGLFLIVYLLLWLHFCPQRGKTAPGSSSSMFSEGSNSSRREYLSIFRKYPRTEPSPG